MDRLLTRKEVADLLQKPESWLRYAERRRAIPYTKVGQQVRYRAQDVEAWLNANRVAGAASTEALTEGVEQTPERNEA